VILSIASHFHVLSYRHLQPSMYIMTHKTTYTCLQGVSHQTYFILWLWHLQPLLYIITHKTTQKPLQGASHQTKFDLDTPLRDLNSCPKVQMFEIVFTLESIPC
jgi:hypothetical protein